MPKLKFNGTLLLKFPKLQVGLDGQRDRVVQLVEQELESELERALEGQQEVASAMEVNKKL